MIVHQERGCKFESYGAQKIFITDIKKKVYRNTAFAFPMLKIKHLPKSQRLLFDEKSSEAFDVQEFVQYIDRSPTQSMLALFEL